MTSCQLYIVHASKEEIICVSVHATPLISSPSVLVVQDPLQLCVRRYYWTLSVSIQKLNFSRNITN